MLMNDNCPRIVNLSNQYYIIAEHDVVTEVANMSDAIFYWFTVHPVLQKFEQCRIFSSRQHF